GGHAAYEDMTDFVAKAGVVAVTINYRVGALGFLDLPGMGRDGGNLGVLDQQAALRWVQRDIGAFGGDPNEVTVGGQSAGGGAVCAQLASPSARGLLQGAVLESAWDCAASRTQAFADGSWARVPVLLGSNSSDIAGLGCQTQRQAESLSRWVPTFRYDFADETAPPLPGRPAQFAGHGAQHSAELEYLYLFNSLPVQLDDAQRDLANQMIAYWSHFIERADPNGRASVEWPSFTSTRPAVLTLTAGRISVATDYDARYSC